MERSLSLLPGGAPMSGDELGEVRGMLETLQRRQRPALKPMRKVAGLALDHVRPVALGGGTLVYYTLSAPFDTTGTSFAPCALSKRIASGR